MAEVEERPRIAILGAGAVGSFLAVIFHNMGYNVYCVARNETAKSINQEGIFLESEKFGNMHATPFADTGLVSEVDFLFVTVKAPFLSDALKNVLVPKRGIKVVISLLNGVEHVSLLRSVFKDRLVVGMITGEFIRDNNNRVQHTTPHARIDLASKDFSLDEVSKFGLLLSRAELNVNISNSEADVIWKKLVKLNALACTTAASQQPLGCIRSDKHWSKLLNAAIREGVAIAHHDGAEIDETEVLREIDNLPAELSTSLQRDIQLGLPSELDSIVGAVIRKANKHDIECNTIKNLFNNIQEKVNYIT